MTPAAERAFEEWMTGLETRHLADLRFSEVSRALRALSSSYVERRATIGQGGALAGSGKRAAFATFYGPLHFLMLQHVAAQLPDLLAPRSVLVDLGCGTGAAGAGLACGAAHSPDLVGIDRHPWAIEEARRTYSTFGLRARTKVIDMRRAEFPARATILAAYALNELDDQARNELGARFLDHAKGGGHILIVEPLAGFVAPWWKRWQGEWEAAGARADEWRVRLPLPALVAKLDKAAGLNHRELTARTLLL